MARIVNRDAHTEEFFDGTRRHEFLLRYSEASGRYYEPAAAVAVEGLGTELGWKAAAGGGTVVSWVVPHVKAADGPMRTVTAVIEFDEGPWWWGPVVDVDPDDMRIGMRVQVGFEDHEDSETFPVFRPA